MGNAVHPMLLASHNKTMLFVEIRQVGLRRNPNRRVGERLITILNPAPHEFMSQAFATDGSMGQDPSDTRIGEPDIRRKHADVGQQLSVGIHSQQMSGSLVPVVNVVIAALLFNHEHLLPQLKNLVQLRSRQISKCSPLPNDFGAHGCIFPTTAYYADS